MTTKATACSLLYLSGGLRLYVCVYTVFVRAGFTGCSAWLFGFPGLALRPGQELKSLFIGFCVYNTFLTNRREDPLHPLSENQTHLIRLFVFPHFL